MKIVIPVAGEGTRLRPHTTTVPKSLLHVAGRPILAHILDQIASLDAEEIVFVIGHQGEKIRNFVVKNYSFNARFVEQTESFGLGYAIHLGVSGIKDDDILIILGDTIVELDWNGLISAGTNRMVVKEVENPGEFGVAEIRDDKIVRLIEKPKEPPSNLAVVGVYYIKDTALFQQCLKEIIDRGITTHGEIQLTDAFGLALQKGIDIETYPTKGWYDCGRPESLLATNHYLLERNAPEAKRKGSIIIAPSFISESARIENSIVGPYVSIGADSVVRNSIVRDSIISNGSQVENANLSNSLIGNRAIVRGKADSLNLGDYSQVGD